MGERLSWGSTGQRTSKEERLSQVPEEACLECCGIKLERWDQGPEDRIWVFFLNFQ